MMSCSHDGKSIKMLTIIDEYTRECLAIVAERRLNSEDVLTTCSRDDRINTDNFRYVTTVCIDLNSNYKCGTNNGRQAVI